MLQARNSSNSNDKTVIQCLNSTSDDTIVVLEGGSEISGSFSPSRSSFDFNKSTPVNEISIANSHSKDVEDGSYLKKKISFFEKSADEDRKRIESNFIDSNTSTSLTKIKEKLSFVSKSKSVHLRETFKPDQLFYAESLNSHSPEEHNAKGDVTYCEALVHAEDISGLTSEQLNPVTQLDYMESFYFGSHDFRSAQCSPDRLSHSKSIIFLNLSPPDLVSSEHPAEDSRRISNGIAADNIVEVKYEAHADASDLNVENLQRDSNSGVEEVLISISQCKINDLSVENAPDLPYQLSQWQSSEDREQPTLGRSDSVSDAEGLVSDVSEHPAPDCLQDASAADSLYLGNSSSSVDASVDDCSSQSTACTMSTMTTTSTVGVWMYVDDNNSITTTGLQTAAAMAMTGVKDIASQQRTQTLTSSQSSPAVTDEAIVGEPVLVDSSRKPSDGHNTHRNTDSKARASISSLRDTGDVVRDLNPAEGKTHGNRVGQYLKSLSPSNFAQRTQQPVSSSQDAEKTKKPFYPIEKVASTELQMTIIYSSECDQEVPECLASHANPMSASKSALPGAAPAAKRFRGLLGDWTYRSIYKSITSPLDYFDRKKVAAKRVPDSVSGSMYTAKWTSEALAGFDKNLVKHSQSKKVNLAAREDLKILKLTIERWILYEFLIDKVDKDLPLTADEKIEFDLITEEFFQQERVKAFTANEKNSKMYSHAERAELSALRSELDRQIRFDGIYRKERNSEPFSFEEKAEYMLLRETLEREQMINQLLDKFKTSLHASAHSTRTRTRSGGDEEMDSPSQPPDVVDLIVMRIEQDKHKRYEQLVAKEKESKKKVSTAGKPQDSGNHKFPLAEKSELAILRMELEHQRKQQAGKVTRLSQELRNGSKDSQLAESAGAAVAAAKSQKPLHAKSTSASDSSSPSSLEGNAHIAAAKSTATPAVPVSSTQSGGIKHSATRSTTSARAHVSASKSPYRGAIATASSVNSPPSMRQAFPVQRLSNIQSSRQNMSEMVLSEFISPLLLYGPNSTASSSSCAAANEVPEGIGFSATSTSLDASALVSNCGYEERRCSTYQTEPCNEDSDDDEHPLSLSLCTPKHRYHQQQQEEETPLATNSLPPSPNPPSSSSVNAAARQNPRNPIAHSPPLPPQEQQQQLLLQRLQSSGKPPIQPSRSRALTPTAQPRPPFTTSSSSPPPTPPRLSFSKMVELSMQQLKSEKERDQSREKQRRLSAFLRNNIDHRSTVADSMMVSRRPSLRSDQDPRDSDRCSQIGAT